MAKSHFIIPFFIPHVGCPFDCIFCNQRRITGKEEIVSPEEILPTVDQYRTTFPENAETVEIAFYGGSFTGIPVRLQERYLEKARAAVLSGKVDAIRLSTRPDYIDSKTLERLKKYGVSTVELGVQSMDDAVLALSCRGHSAGDVITASQRIKDFGFHLGLQMMIGLPGSNQNSDRETAIEVSKLKPDFVRIYPTLVVRGTVLEEMYINGLYEPLSLNRAVDICKDIVIIFIKNDIEVIRIGLQPTEMINLGKDVAAGPFHPAFRQLVDALILRKAINEVLRKKGDIKEGCLTIEVNPSLISGVIGIRKENINRIRSDYPGLQVKARQNSDVDRTCIRFYHTGSSFEIDYLEMIKIS